MISQPDTEDDGPHSAHVTLSAKLHRCWLLVGCLGEMHAVAGEDESLGRKEGKVKHNVSGGHIAKQLAASARALLEHVDLSSNGDQQLVRHGSLLLLEPIPAVQQLGRIRTMAKVIS